MIFVIITVASFARFQHEKRLLPLYQKRAQLLSSPSKLEAAAAAATAAAAAAGAPSSTLASTAPSQPAQAPLPSAAAPENAAAAEAETAVTPSAGYSVATPGLPGFWLSVLEREAHTARSLSSGDRACLLYLEDVRADKRLRKEDGFSVSFVFAANPFFSNRVLSKEICMQKQGDDAVVAKTIGTEIHWNEGMVGRLPHTTSPNARTENVNPNFWG